MSTIIKHKEFPKFKSWTMDLCGRPLTIEVGKVAELASASAMVKYGETTVMVAVTVSPRPRDGVDFFPLSVDFEEKLYAVGRIPGSFMRREGRPSLPAVLASRLIDRPMRPLFPYDFRNDVVVTATVMSVDRDCSPEVTAMIGVSACLAYSEIPWAGPIGCLEVGYVDGQIVLNPTNEQKHASQLDLTVAATEGKVIMIEAGAKELPDDIMYEAIVKAHEEIRAQVASVFYNRLNNFGDPNYGFLQSDATTAYELGHDPTPEDIKNPTPFNTYTNTGLPPTPICSPGLDCLQAVCNPAQTNYFFFYFAPDESGTMQYYFSETYEEHQQTFS